MNDAVQRNDVSRIRHLQIALRNVLLTVVAACVSGGCAADRPFSILVAGPPVYVLSAKERSWDCEILGRAIYEVAEHAAALPHQIHAESQAPPRSVVRWLSGLSGAPSTQAGDALAEHRARMAAYNERLRELNCREIDIDRALARK